MKQNIFFTRISSHTKTQLCVYIYTGFSPSGLQKIKQQTTTCFFVIILLMISKDWKDKTQFPRKTKYLFQLWKLCAHQLKGYHSIIECKIVLCIIRTVKYSKSSVFYNWRHTTEGSILDNWRKRVGHTKVWAYLIFALRVFIIIIWRAWSFFGGQWIRWWWFCHLDLLTPLLIHTDGITGTRWNSGVQCQKQILCLAWFKFINFK